LSRPPKHYEGPALEPLLEQVHNELGPDARIVNAEKVRQGGYMGFFAREAYRLEVAPADEPAPTVQSVPVPQPIPAQPRATDQPLLVVQPHPVVAGDRSVPPVAMAVASLGSDPFAQLAAEADDVVEPPTSLQALPSASPAPIVVAHVTTSPVPAVGDGPIFTHDVATVMDAAEAVANGDAAGPDDTTLVRPSAAMARIAIALAKPLDASEFSEEGETAADEEFAAVLRRVAASADTSVDVGDGVGSEPVSVQATALPLEALAVAHDVPPAPAVDAAADAGDELEDQLDEIARFLAEQSTPVFEEPPSHIPSRSRSRRTLADTSELAKGLRRLGFDDEATRQMAADVATGHDLAHELLERFSVLPDAPPLPHLPGSLLVVVGSGERAFELAAQFAEEIDVDPDAVYVASASATLRRRLPVNRCIRSTEEAAERAPGWRRSSVAVVAVDAPIAGRTTAWARHIIDVLRPTAVWGAVDAVCKTEDVDAWADSLGGLDAIVLDSVGSSVSPVAVTTTGIPVARIDERRATAARWTSLALERLEP
jgi:hypothetical protein